MAKHRRSIYISKKPVRLDPDYVQRPPMTDEELRNFIGRMSLKRKRFQEKCEQANLEWNNANRERKERMELVQGYTRYLTVLDTSMRTKFIVLIRAGYSIYDNDYNFQACVETIDDLHDIFDDHGFKFHLQGEKFVKEVF